MGKQDTGNRELMQCEPMLKNQYRASLKILPSNVDFWQEEMSLK